MGPGLQRLDLVLHLEVDPGLDQLLGEDVAQEKKLIIPPQCFE